jgi:adenylosuccinate synthase
MAPLIIFLIMEAIITVGLSFGDEGKGKVVDALVRKHNSGLVVRYSGGSQAAHSVVLDNGTHHVFAQLGAGSFNKETETLLSHKMLVEPLALMIEADIFNKKIDWDIYPYINVAADCFVITPFHQTMNQIRELIRGEGRHGSCGKGIGETRAFIAKHEGFPHLKIGNLRSKSVTAKILEMTRDLLQREAVELLQGPMTSELLKAFEWFKWDIDALVEDYSKFVTKINILSVFEEELLIKEQKAPVIFEGSQGILLDEHFGFAPFNTWSDLNPRAAMELLPERCKVHTVGILRALTTRHGPGPFPTEDLDLTQKYQDPRNPTNNWQREFRVGHFDLTLLRYSLACINGVDSLAVTHADILKDQDTWRMAYGYEIDGIHFRPSVISEFQSGNTKTIIEQTENMQIVDCLYRDVAASDVLDMIEFVSGIPIKIVGHGPAASEISFR